MDIALLVLISAISGGGAGGAVIFVARTWISERIKASIKAEYDQRLETHRAQLKSQGDVELEKLRSQLSVTASEHNIRFTHLHVKQAEVIAETYQLLWEGYTKLGDYVSVLELAGSKPKSEKRAECADALNAFIAFFHKHRIYIPKETAARIDGIVQHSKQAYNQFLWIVELSPSKTLESNKAWTEVYERVEGPMKAALGELEDEFRMLLGASA